MKKERFKHLRSKAFRNYLFSYVGVFFITLNMLSTVAIRHFVANMRAEEIRVMESKLYTIAEDMEIQMEAMRGMAIEIASLEDFRLDYFQSSKYNEIEMLNRLKKYGWISDICEYYFIKYSASEIIFTSAGTTTPLQVYLRNEFEEYGEIMERIELSCTESSERVVLYKQGDTILFLYPLEKYAISKSGMEGVLCFQVSKESLQERIKKIVGRMNGELTIYYRDFCILGDAVESGETAEHESILMQQSLTGNFKIYYCMDENGYFTWSNVFSVGEVITFISISVLLFVLTLFVAYWSFKPMRRITEKYKSKAEGDLAADWDSIDALIESLLHGEERSSKLLQQQYQMLREQAIQLIASGGYSDRLQEHLTLLNIKLDAPVYGIIKCSFPETQELSKQRESMYKDIEDLSGDGMTLYSYWDSDGDLCVFATIEEEYQLEEIIELLQSLFETKNLSAVTEVAAESHDLKQMNQNFAKDIGYDQDIDMDKVSEKQNSTAWQVVEYIKSNCTNYDLSLDLIAQEFHVTSTYLCRIIKQETGMSYKEYLTGLRINEAKRILMDKNISVVDVCQQIGYGNVSHFIKVFQKYTGVTPAKYRDEH